MVRGEVRSEKENKILTDEVREIGNLKARMPLYAHGEPMINPMGRYQTRPTYAVERGV